VVYDGTHIGYHVAECVDATRFDTIDLHLIRVLHTVITERSVSRAALKLASTQPAVSAQLKRLRALTGDPLLVRAGQRHAAHGRALAIAGPGRALLQDAERCSAAALQRAAAFEPASRPGPSAWPPATTSTRCSCPRWWRTSSARRPACGWS
jgi:hypothetical protein